MQCKHQINNKAGRRFREPGNRKTSSIPHIIGYSKIAATSDLARLKALSLKSIFWKMVAIYKILHIYLDSVRGLDNLKY